MILNLREGKTIGCAKVYVKKLKYVLDKNKRIKRKNSRIYGLGYIFCLIETCLKKISIITWEVLNLYYKKSASEEK